MTRNSWFKQPLQILVVKEINGFILFEFSEDSVLDFCSFAVSHCNTLPFRQHSLVFSQACLHLTTSSAHPELPERNTCGVFLESSNHLLLLILLLVFFSNKTKRKKERKEKQ